MGRLGAIEEEERASGRILLTPRRNHSCFQPVSAGFAEGSGACVGILPVLNALDLCGQIFEAEVHK
jgi:hypothetical protein